MTPRLPRTLTALVAALLAAGAATTAAPAASAATPVARITPAAGCHDVVPGAAGVKVKLVQRALGMPAGTWEEMGPTTVSKVKSFQAPRALRKDGVVDRATWTALGIQEDFCIDRVQASPQLPVSAPSAQRVEAFVGAALSYVGEEYVWGGAGPRGYGFDCSGLVLQSLYAAGIDPQPVSLDLHVRSDYRTTQALFDHSSFTKVPLSQARRGDLVFYTSNSTGRINHVAIHLGGNQVVEASGSDVHVSPLARSLPSQTVVQTAVRPVEPTVAVSPADGRYVDALYRDFLGRSVDPAGASTWGGQLATTRLSRYQLSLELARTDEYLGATADSAYRDVLDRDADPTGRAGWVRALRGGMPVATMRAGFYASQEHYAANGGTPTDPSRWVSTMYREVLGRSASSSEVDHWVAVAQQRGRLHVAYGFVNSPESLNRRVHQLYGRFLGRSADPTGLRSWPSVILRDGDLALAAHLTSSAEYYHRAQAR